MANRRFIALGAACLCSLSSSVALAGECQESSSQTATASAAPAAPTFGRLFPDLPALTISSTQQLADLASSMQEQGEVLATGEDVEDPGNNPNVPSGFTYMGQFIDHDITRDESPPPTGPVDPQTLANARTPALDLDSLYGGGPSVRPELYNGAKLRLTCRPAPPDGADPQPGENAFEVCDVPRDPATGAAIIGDNRNDENIIILQLHVAFARFHNALVDRGRSFEDARRITQHYYQWLIFHDYLPTVLGPDRVTDRGLTNADRMPIEFSVGAFRFGHSEVRNAYQLSELTHPTQPDGHDAPLAVPVFSLTPGVQTLAGGHPLALGLGIDWAYFFDVEGAFDDFGNLSRRIDARMAPSLFQLPIPGAEATGSNVLAFRTLTRSALYGMPSGEAVSRELGITPLRRPTFPEGTPLWYYVLRESQARENGLRLGQVGAAIVSDVMFALLHNTPDAIGPDWRPRAQLMHGDRFTMGDLLLAGGSFTETQLEDHLEEQAEEAAAE